MNICFVANFSKTYLHEAIALELSKENIQVFWIAVNRNLYNHLSKTYARTHILLINKENVIKEEIPVLDFKINEIIYGDRIWRENPDNARQFLTNIQLPIHQFIQNNNITKIFGELTWAHEILIHRMCSEIKALKCTYLNPHVVRIPNNRFAFFTDERQSKLLEIKNSRNNNFQILKPKPPNYLKINRTIQKKKNSRLGKIKNLKKFILSSKADRHDPSMDARFMPRLKTYFQTKRKSKAYHSLEKNASKDLLAKPFVFITLHKQPEASVDVFGRYYEDQLMNIKNVWRALPQGWNLLVKEHSIAIGDRDLSFYKELCALPNVYLVKENASSYHFAQQAELVITVTGTIAYEAALMNVPSLTFVPTFFNQLSYCERLTLNDLSKYNLKQIQETILSKKENIGAFSKYIYSNSFEGNVLDPVTDSSVLDESNIRSLAKAYRTAIFNEIQISKPQILQSELA